MIAATLEYNSKTYQLEYHECDRFDDLPREQCTQIYGVCFLGDQTLVVHNGDKDTWGLVGGTPEDGETIEQALRREIQEESNMRVVTWKPIGFQKVAQPDGSVIYQLRAYCEIEKIGEFEGDPDDDIDRIKLIDPTEVKQYFDWQEIGDQILGRACRLHISAGHREI